MPATIKNSFMKKFQSIFIGVLFAVASTQAFAETFEVKSPDGKISAFVEDGSQVKFSIKADGKTLLENCAIGMDTDKGFFGRNARVVAHQTESHKGEIKTVYGIRKSVKDEYNQLSLDFKDFKILVRVYNEAAAYRFVSKVGGELVVNDELLELSSLTDSDKTVAHVVQAVKTSFERPWTRQSVADLKKSHSASLPFFFEKDGLKVAVVESAWLDYPGVRIAYPKDAKSPRAIFSKTPKKLGFGYRGSVGGSEYDGLYIVKENENDIAKTSGHRAFPWRGFIVARNDIDFADNDTVYKLGEPSKIEDTSWIVYGSTVWDWWVDWNIENVDFPVGFNLETCKYYVDFAAAHNIPLVTLDAGWHVGRSPDAKSRYNATEEFLNGKPAVDIPAVVKYAESKGVKVIIWVYSKVMYDQPERALDLFKSWGVAGLKIDFTDRDDQWAINHFENINRLAAERKMVIDWHGCPSMPGMSRTYPNAINFEGVCGAEFNKFKMSSRFLTPSHNVDLVFTRMLNGPMDYTPGGMRNRTNSTYNASRELPEVRGTRAHMMAQYILYYAPLQMLSDMTTEYLKHPEILKFLAETPTSWDETKAVEGKMGEYVVVARRKGDVWYLGGMCDWGGKTVDIDLSKILPKGTYDAELFIDGVNSDKIATDYKRVVRKLKSTDILQVKMKKGGGFALRLVPESLFGL